MELKIEVKSCKDCPCRHNSMQGTTYFSYCLHPLAPMGWANTIDQNIILQNTTTKWCPIKNT